MTLLLLYLISLPLVYILLKVLQYRSVGYVTHTPISDAARCILWPLFVLTLVLCFLAECILSMSVALWTFVLVTIPERFGERQ